MFKVLIISILVVSQTQLSFADCMENYKNYLGRVGTKRTGMDGLPKDVLFAWVLSSTEQSARAVPEALPILLLISEGEKTALTVRRNKVVKALELVSNAEHHKAGLLADPERSLLARVHAKIKKKNAKFPLDLKQFAVSIADANQSGELCRKHSRSLVKDIQKDLSSAKDEDYFDIVLTK